MARTSNRGRRRNDDRHRDGHGSDRDARRDNRDRDRSRDGNRDSYRPRSPPRNDRKQRFEWDNWQVRDGDGGGGRDRRYDAPPPHPPKDFRGDGGDSYRPRPPQGDFTFRMQQPPGITQFPPNGAHSSHDGRDARRGRRGDRRGGSSRGRGPGRRWQPVHPSQRALVSGATLGRPEERLNDDSEPARFRDLEDMSDDDELAMDISSRSSDSESDDQQPSKKRARTVAEPESATDSAAAPKWSNPDPYTALPCPDDTAQKKKDVLKLIRKARVEEDEKKPAATTKAEDFISFDPSSDEDQPPKKAPRLPKAHQLPNKPPPPAEPAPPPPPPPIAPPPAAPLPTLTSSSTPTNGVFFTNGSALLTVPSRDPNGPLGSRKRTADDVIKPPDYGHLKKTSMKPVKGLMTPVWELKPDEDPCPWATIDHTGTLNMPFRLHKEVIDFYEYVRPRQFEHRIRENLVENLKKAMRRDGRNFASAQVHAFGSFMSGLYLPTADMDLVVCSASFMRGGPPTYLAAKSWLYKFQKFLVSQEVAEQGSIEVIAHARIPLVKFVDKLTGLRVDVSFENMGGVDAINTFMRWKKQYPSMPILVTLIKHYLLMRGLNEPVNGGIGGFSVICLVVSMLQMMPQVQSRNMIPEHHLGEILLEFFDLYGRQFEHESNAISLTRPIGYIRKNKVSSFTYKNKDRLSIIDPNNPANDIAGGSANTAAILARFHDAYNVLRERMKEIASDPDKGGILDVIMQGDYSTFRMQREYLRHVQEKVLGPCPE